MHQGAGMYVCSIYALCVKNKELYTGVVKTLELVFVKACKCILVTEWSHFYAINAFLAEECIQYLESYFIL